VHYVHEVHKVHGVHDICSSFCHSPRMAIFTLAEIEAQIAAYKQALLAVAGGKSFRMVNGVTDRTWTSDDSAEIRKTLEWLDSERTKLTIGSGPQILVGRPTR
jgi:hypothetical protein